LAEWERKVKRELMSNSFTLIPSAGKGSHQRWTNGSVTVTVPKTVSKQLANVILNQAGISKRF
jgi:predicted RNA binding protein YcfA (HicA-like mRNA interferase family)